MEKVDLVEEITYVWFCPSCNGAMEEHEEVSSGEEVECEFCSKIYEIS